MSLVKVAGNASGTGTITIQAPNTNTNYTLDLPAAAGTIQLSGNAISGTTGTFSGTISGGSTIGVGGATPANTGAGITFPATQSASTDANTLDDYEQGTWTPSLGGNTTYNAQIGRYTKIGRMVYVSCYLEINQIGTGSTTQISGLPFALSGVQDVESCFSVAASGSSIATSVVSFTVYCASTTIYVYSRTAAAKTESANAIFANTAGIELAGWYQTAD